jgi:hypothetical protein
MQVKVMTMERQRIWYTHHFFAKFKEHTKHSVLKEMTDAMKSTTASKHSTIELVDMMGTWVTHTETNIQHMEPDYSLGFTSSHEISFDIDYNPIISSPLKHLCARRMRERSRRRGEGIQQSACAMDGS